LQRLQLGVDLLVRGVGGPGFRQRLVNGLLLGLHLRVQGLAAQAGVGRRRFRGRRFVRIGLGWVGCVHVDK